MIWGEANANPTGSVFPGSLPMKRLGLATSLSGLRLPLVSSPVVVASNVRLRSTAGSLSPGDGQSKENLASRLEAIGCIAMAPKVKEAKDYGANSREGTSGRAMSNVWSSGRTPDGRRWG